jgi:hypothetical protein
MRLSFVMSQKVCRYALYMLSHGGGEAGCVMLVHLMVLRDVAVR